MNFITNIKVRNHELDANNHVNNAIYLQYLESARMDYLRAIDFDYEGFFNAGYFLYVTHIDIHYRASARLFDELSIDVEPVRFGKASGTFHQTIKNQRGEICAEADVTWACVNSSGKPSKMPEEFKVTGLSPELLPESQEQ